MPHDAEGHIFVSGQISVIFNYTFFLMSLISVSDVIPSVSLELVFTVSVDPAGLEGFRKKLNASSSTVKTINELSL